MDMSRLLDPAEPMEVKSTEIHHRALPECLEKWRENPKFFRCDNYGGIHLPVPDFLERRRAILPPWPEWLFESNAILARRLTERLAKQECDHALHDVPLPVHANMARDRDFQQADENLLRARDRVLDDETCDDLSFSSENINDEAAIIDDQIYADMHVDPRFIRSDEEEQRVRKYHMALTTLSSGYQTQPSFRRIIFIRGIGLQMSFVSEAREQPERRAPACLCFTVIDVISEQYHSFEHVAFSLPI